MASMSGILRRARGGTGIAVATLLFLTTILAFSFFSSSPAPYDRSRSARSKLNILGLNDNLDHISNSTLGFQKIYAINLPERTDKQDAILLQAKLTNFSVEFVDGVRGSEVSRNALPLAFNQSDGAIGCWRAHLNVWKMMIKENVESALILEDDSDWDIGLKGQLTEFARGSRWLLESDGKARQSPYGNNWDVLWFGHCYSIPTKSDSRRWVIPHDPTVPPEGVRVDFRHPDMSPWEQGDKPDGQTRIIYRQEYGWCTAGYAISLRGAKRMLYASAGIVDYDSPIDLRMGTICGGNYFPDFTCIAPFPRLIGIGRGAGDAAKVSDIQKVSPDEVEIFQEDRSENIMFSVRHNIERILNGETTFKSFFPNPSGDSLTLEEITRARGHAEYIELPPEGEKKKQKDGKD